MTCKAAIFLALLFVQCKASNANSRHSNAAFAKDCRFNEKGRQCKWDDADLDLDRDEIEMTVDESGPIITCFRNLKASKPGTFVGQCDGNAQSANFVERRNKKGVVHIFGSIVVGDEICHMTKEKVSCESSSSYPEEEEMEEPPLEDGERDLAAVGQSLRGSTSLDLGDGRRLYDDSGKNLDIMVVWTEEAECRQSGFDRGCIVDEDTELEMRGLVDLAVAETNTAFKVSGIKTELRLVHAYRDDTYTEPITKDKRYNAIIADLQNKDDGKLDSVHIEREKYGADFVSMIVGSSGSCGIGFSGSRIYASKMFSVIRFSCATGNYSFGHELAHNAGAFHDRTAMKHCKTNGYNYGWRDPNANFRSILAYSCGQGGCDDNAGGNCPRVQMFSNPVHKYNGQPIGDSDNDNRRVFNENKGAIAALFAAMDCKTDSDCDDGNSCTIDSCGSNGACVHETDYATCAQTCPVGQKNFQLYLDTDNAGGQISWSLVNDCTGATVHSGSGYGNNNVYNIDECIDEKAQYTFSIFDSGSNGLCCSNGFGEYTVLYDGSMRRKGTSFGSYDIVTLGGTCPTPTDSPVLSPTDAPVPSPTDAPIVSPTDAPVPSPTHAPIVSPTNAPVPSPTDAPVVPPTDAPVPLTLSPSRAPTPTENPWVEFWKSLFPHLDCESAAECLSKAGAPSPAPSLKPSPAPSPAPSLAPTSSSTSSWWTFWFRYILGLLTNKGKD